MLILLDVCVIPEDNMNKNNMWLKWKLEENKLCAKTGDIDLVCNSVYYTMRARKFFLSTCWEVKLE